MARLEKEKPDLIVTYRHLFEAEKDLPFSLGTYADMLIQTTTTPVLLVPAPGRPELIAALENTDRVMVLSDHLVNDGRLINWGLRLVEQGGRITLVHIEDDAVFDRYLAAISKIPGLDTELAKTAIEERLLHEASDYADDVKTAFEADHPNVQVAKNIRLGHTVKEVLAVAAHEACDLVVLNTKDEDQLAMAGKAYSVAVELIDKPLLLL
jgi:nucleotide-binding universal stress UspA family protein